MVARSRVVPRFRSLSHREVAAVVDSLSGLPPVTKSFRLAALNLREANRKSRSWLERRSQQQASRACPLSRLVQGLFASVQTDGKVSGLQIVEQLIYLGLASDPATLISVSPP